MKLLSILSLAAGLAGAAVSPVRVSPRDHGYLELESGEPYVPIGLNIIAPPYASLDEETAFRGFEDWLRELAANHGNYIRVWLSSPFWDVEHSASGQYDEARAGRIDRLLKLCEKYGIRVKFTLEHFRSIGGGPQAWADKPLHHVSRGGAAQSIADFFDGAASRDQFRAKIRWYAARFGFQPQVFGWELWNEINAVRGGDYMAWTEAMLPELHRAFPRNLCLQSLGSFDTERARALYRRHSTMPGNDLAQVHRYLDLGAALEVCHAPVDVLAADAVRELLSYAPDRPVVLAESGAVEPRHSGPFKLYTADREGTLLHDVLFAPFFAGAAGAGQIWHWDSYVAANRLWYHFGRFAEAVKGIDPPAEGFQPSMIEHPRLRVYALAGKRHVLLWCRDAQSTWMSELRDGVKPEVLRGVRVEAGKVLSGRRVKQVDVYDPWADQHRKATLRKGRVELPAFTRSVVVRIELR